MNDIDQKTDAYTFADRLNDPKAYWDLTKIPGATDDSYQDWEGFADTQRVKEIVDGILEKWEVHVEEGEQKQWVTDMLLHYVFEVVDQVGEEALPNEDTLFGMVEAFQFIVQAPRYMMRSDAE